MAGVRGRDSAVFSDEVREQDSLTSVVLDAYRARMDTLRTDAALDGYCLNSLSERDFWFFVASDPDLRKGHLVLMDNGNLRAVWKDREGTHLGLQFLGGGMVQYVIFKRRKAGQPISRVTGRDSFDGLRRQIDAFDLNPLLYIGDLIAECVVAMHPAIGGEG